MKLKDRITRALTIFLGATLGYLTNPSDRQALASRSVLQSRRSSVLLYLEL
jgi:hypothetical protein